jgi:predicted nucleic acid-binding protein
VRQLRPEDPVVVDTGVFLDTLPFARVAGRDRGARADTLDASEALMAAIERCAARLGVTDRLTDQWASTMRVAVGQAAQAIARLRDLKKLDRRPASANQADAASPSYRQFPPEDRFLLDAAAATRAPYIVTTDPRIPLGPRRVPLNGGGEHEVEVLTPTQLLARLP